jgi:hypothetical protein
LQRKKKKKKNLALNFRLAVTLYASGFKKAQQLMVSNAFPAQDFI